MNALGRFLSVYFTGQDPDGERTPPPVGDADEPFETGTDLTSRIEEAIRARRPVLVTGPRGSGKSRCCEDAIQNVRGKAVRGKFFLQGNREIPREYLSEDMLVLDRAGKPRLLKALALRTREDEAAMERLDRAEPTFDGAPGAAPPGVNPGQAGGHLAPEPAFANPAVAPGQVPAPAAEPPKRADCRQRFASSFPALPANEVSRDELAQIWTDEDWSVLYLDEINRFGDGFLDALLSLLEEGKIVRRGYEYYVPLTVVATANPPGYDITAKKLSPPLQARIARSFRVAQPSLGTLVNPILTGLVKDVLRNKSLDGAIRAVLADPAAQEPWLRRVAATVLCLWGDPSRGLPGHSFLTVATRDLLKALAVADANLGAAMRDLCDLSLFGPDARSAGAWYLAAAGRAAAGQGDGAQLEMRPEHLLGTVRETLNNKLRENFNEGTEPEKTIRKELLIHRIASRLIKGEADSDEFPTPEEQLAKRAVEQLVMGERHILAGLGVEENRMQEFLPLESPPEAEKAEHRLRRRWLLVVGAFPGVFREGRVDVYLRPLERLLEGLQLLPDEADRTGGAAASVSAFKFLTALVASGAAARRTVRRAAVERVFHTFGLATAKP